MATKYRAGIIATGSIAGAHAKAYNSVQEIELVACADVDEPCVRAFAATHGVGKTYTNFREMLDKEHLDIVSVCSWHFQHAEMTIAAATRQPKVILCEKPMATSLGEAEQMMIACQRNQVKLAIGFQRRFLPAWTRAKELIAEGAIGVPQRVSHTRETGLLNATSHGLDCIRYILGDPDVEWVFGQVERKTDKYERGTRCEDCVAGFLLFEGGVQATFQTDLIPGSAQWAFVQGTEGMMDFDDGWIRLFNAKTNGWQDLPVPESNPFVLQAEELVGWIEDRCVHRGQAENGMWTIYMMLGVYESARRHEVVRMPLQTRVNPLDLMVESGDLPVERPGWYDIRSLLLHGEAMTMKR